MAGGSGSRLRPLTCDLPKPMVPVMAKPVMTYSIELLKKYGIKDIGITLQYLPQVIEDYFQDGSTFGVKLHYFVEETPLGTAGSVKNAEKFLDETFVVISGDALTDINISKAINFHREKKAIATLVLKKVQVPLEYGVVIIDESGAVTRFLEKPNWSEVFSDTVNTGIYILEPEVLTYFKAGQKFDFSQDLFPLLLEKGKPMYGYITDEYWCDIGNLQTYLQAHYDMLSGKVRFPIPGQKIGENIWVGENVDIAPEARLEGPCYIGDYTRIREGAYVGPFTVIGRYNDIGPHTSIKRSVLWDYNTLSRCVEIRGAAVCNKVDIRERVSIYEGAVVGNGCTLKPRVSVKPDVKIWPEKVIEHGTTVQSNVIWGTRFSKTLFGKNGITGKLNVDLDPRFAVRLGAALGAELKPNKRVAISCDDNTGSAMLKYGIISGLLSSGVEVLDLGMLTTPILRYMVPYFGLEGGIHVFEDKKVDGNVGIHFIDRDGGNFSPAFERQIENAFVREDFQRVAADKIPKVQNFFNVPLFYAKALEKLVDADVIRNYGFKVLFSTPSRLVASIAETIFSDVGCELHIAKDDIPLELEKAERGQYSLACHVDSNGEELELYDEKGKRVSREMCGALRVFLCLNANDKKEVVVPYTAPTAIETMVQSLQGKVIRTKTSRYALMNEVIKREGNGSGVFLLYADAIAMLLKLLEVLAKEHKMLSELTSAIPRFYMKEKVIECPWEEKGKVMRWLIQEETKGNNVVELFEGVKVHHKNGWALVLPDSEEAVCRIYSEGVSEEYAEELTKFYEDKINCAKKQ
nr:sugar phosphate nucleotidyltransferase [Caldicoprobacter algeriensis]